MSEHGKYKFWYAVSGLYLRLMYRVRAVGRENIPDGPAIICANHSHWADPFFIAYAFGKKHHLHMMAKAELFRRKLIARILESIGTFPVSRGENDISSVRRMMKYLKAGEKVVMFPEGTRTSRDGEVEAKTGAVAIASRMRVPVIPVYVPRVKRKLRSLTIVIGEPYLIGADGGKPPQSRYREATEALMARISALGA